MTSPSLAALLFAESRPTVKDLEPAVQAAAADTEAGGLPGGLATIVGNLAQEELDAALERACGTRLATILIRGWQEFVTLEDAAVASLEHPGTEQPVSLGDHHITLEQHPDLDVVVAGVHAVSVPLVLLARLELTDIVAVVADGALVAVRGGRVGASLRLAAAQVALASADTSVDLDVALPLAHPVDLRGQRDAPQGIPKPRNGR